MLLLTEGVIFAATADTSNQNYSSNFTLADTGISLLDNDVFIPLFVEQGVSYKTLDLVFSGPFRFRVVDNAPHESAVLRQQDWDEPSDWARILRKIQYQKEFTGGDFTCWMGELNDIQMGHQQLVSHYYNSTDMDHYHGGLDSIFQIRGSGLEVMLNDIVVPDFGAVRLFIAPLAWFRDTRFFRSIKLGFYAFLDKGVESRTIKAGSTSLAAAGGDLSASFLVDQTWSITPYLSLGGMDGDVGFHGGFSVENRQERNDGIHFFALAEYRYAGADYFPSLINPFYDHNRRFFTIDPVSTAPNTFADHLANPLMAEKSAHGFAVETELGMMRKFQLGLRYDFMAQNRPHWVLLKLHIRPTESSSITIFYAGQDVDGGPALFSSGALVGVAYHHQIAGPLRFFGEYSRRYRRVDDDESAIANEATMGIGLAMGY